MARKKKFANPFFAYVNQKLKEGMTRKEAGVLYRKEHGIESKGPGRKPAQLVSDLQKKIAEDDKTSAKIGKRKYNRRSKEVARSAYQLIEEARLIVKSLEERLNTLDEQREEIHVELVTMRRITGYEMKDGSWHPSPAIDRILLRGIPEQAPASEFVVPAEEPCEHEDPDNSGLCIKCQASVEQMAADFDRDLLHETRASIDASN